MISSKVNQWTLLVGALPAAFALSHGSFEVMHLDARQREEIFLTTAQSIFGLMVIADFRFTLMEALLLLGLFLPQFAFTSPLARYVEGFAYLALSAGMLIRSRDSRGAALRLLPRRRRRSP
jgi:cation:H+ antiporter